MNAVFHPETTKFRGRDGRVVRDRRLVCVLDGVHVGVSRRFVRREALAGALAARDRAVREAMEALAAVCPKPAPAVAMPWLARMHEQPAALEVPSLRGVVRPGVNLLGVDTSDLCAELERRGYEVGVAS